ncbi:hypothetical protein MVEN_00055400 [Mycena venus]|uniref:Uncharacterized protein n=1 Tax=Mycena venus TaxID=2733690 RepID=A0A8H6Z7E2_9AGAR|nr:hypothetical protein MVEN_00055400 [Mycena venus]
MSRSILVAGAHTSSVTLSGPPVTAVSDLFVKIITPNRQNNLLALTINGGIHGPFTTVLECSVQPDMTVDVSLGLDWTASVRNWLIDLHAPCSPDSIHGLVHALNPSSGPSPVVIAYVGAATAHISAVDRSSLCIIHFSLASGYPCTTGPDALPFWEDARPDAYPSRVDA